MPKAKMKQEYKQEWIDALRSGEYPQTTGVLRRLGPSEPIHGLSASHLPAGYCCLGVLCEILVRQGILERSEIGDFAEYGPPVPSALKEDFALPAAAMEIIDLWDVDGDHGEDAYADVSVDMSDLPRSLQRVVLRYLGGGRDEQSLFTLANLNDAGAPFSIIADVIEHGIEGI